MHVKYIFDLRQTKIRALHFLICIISVIIINSRLYSQTASYKSLIKSIQDLPLIDSDSINHNTLNLHQRIEDKLNYANTYLTIELNNLTLSDSSKYYEEQLSRLKKSEKNKLLNTKDSLSWLNELEKQYLLVAMLNPSKSDTIFHKIIKIWFDIKKPISFVGNTESSINFKIWLFEKSEERFKSETKYFTFKKELCYFNKAMILSFSNYRSLLDEKNKLELIENSLKLSKRDSLLNYSYNKRALTLCVINDKLQSDSLNSYIESLFLKAYKLKPSDYNTNYNLYVFYYNLGVRNMNNLGVRIMNNLSNELCDEDLDKILEKAKQYFEKSRVYAEAIGIKQEVEKLNNK